MFKLTQNNIEKIVKILFWFTFAIFIAGLMLLVGAFLTGSQKTAQAFLLVLTEGGTAFGLYKKAPWVAPLLTLFSSLGILNGLFQPVNSIFDLIIKLSSLGLNILFVFFFTRKEVRTYFKTRSEYIFSK